MSKRRIYDLMEERVLPKPRNGKHNVKECRKRYHAYKVEHDKESRIARDAAQAQADLDAGRPIRWTVELAAREFCVSEARLRRELARIYGTRTPLPDGRDSRTYLAHLRELEKQAKAARHGAWGTSHP